jgi:hypothetical protein
VAVVEALTEEECYLYAIFEDISGLDLGEFVMVDEEQDDGCWRAWPFQWSWYRCNDTLQIDQMARAVGKSQSIKIRAFIFPFAFPGNQMVITAPELVHLEPITKLIEECFYGTKLGRAIMQRGRSAVTHRPFQISFSNGATIIGRIPQKDGKGCKGLHPLWLELDEGQDYPTPGWTELIETLKRGKEGAVWRAHGVTRGVRDYFYKLTADPNTRWTVHRTTAMSRPNWTDEERQEKIDMYGGREDPDYKRNVLGEHGDSVSPIFVLHRLMQNLDDEKGSDYNIDEYFKVHIKDSMLTDYYGQADITSFLNFPSHHKNGKRNFFVGMDVGYTNHPSEILVFAEEIVTPEEKRELKKRGKACPEGKTRLKLLTRVSLVRIGNPDQVKVILSVINFYKPKAFSMDSTGVGLPLYQDIQYQNLNAATVIKPYNFSSKILVDFDQNIEVDPWDNQEKKAGIERNVVEYATDRLRKMVDDKRLWLPWDEDLIGEFQGQTYRVTKTTMNQYGKKEYRQGKFHALDAARMAILGWSQESIDFLTKKKETPVLDLFFN